MKIEELDPDYVFSPQITLFEPFAKSVDPSRTNMSSKQLTQVVVSENVEVPFIFNKSFKDFTHIKSPFVEFAENDGIILYRDDKILLFFDKVKKRLKNFYIPPYKSWDAFSIKLKYINPKTDIQKGDILFDYSHQTPDNLPRIGYRTKVLYSSFFGFNADDAIAISESYAKRATVDYNTKILIPITKELKYIKNEDGTYFYDLGKITPSEYLKYIKIDTSKHALSEFNNISNKESKFFSKVIDSIEGGIVSDIKIHKLNDADPNIIKAGYMFNDGLIDEVEEMYESTKLKYSNFLNYMKTLPIDEQTAKHETDAFFSKYITNNKLNKTIIMELVEKYNIDYNLIDYVLEIDIGYQLNTDVGDKFANCYAGKGVIALIVPDHLMPGGADMVFNSLGVFGRNNWGTVYEETLSYIIIDIQNKCREFNNYLTSLEETPEMDHGSDEENINILKDNILSRLLFINEKFIKTIDIKYHNDINNMVKLIDTNLDSLKEFVNDVEKNGLYIYIDNFPDITYNDFMKNFILPYEKEFNINCSAKEPVLFSRELSKWLKDKGFTNNIFTEPNDDIMVNLKMSYNYFIKLQHTSDSKFNSVSFASSYSASTGQPNKGRKRLGGAHLSWMSTSAFSGQVKNSNIKKEFYTIKSDVSFKEKSRMSMILMSGKDYYLKDHYTSLTKNAINVTLKLIGLSFQNKNILKTIPEKIKDYNLDDLFDDVEVDENTETIVNCIEEDSNENNFEMKILDEDEFKKNPVIIQNFSKEKYKFIQHKDVTIDSFLNNAEIDNNADIEYNVEDILGNFSEDESDEPNIEMDMDEIEELLDIDSELITSVGKQKIQPSIDDFGNDIGFESDTYDLPDNGDNDE